MEERIGKKKQLNLLKEFIIVRVTQTYFLKFTLFQLRIQHHIRELLKSLTKEIEL